MPVTIDGSSGLTANDGSVFTNASGNVGIGTSSPGQKLDVIGGTIYEQVQLGTNNTSSSAQRAGLNYRNFANTSNIALIHGADTAGTNAQIFVGGITKNPNTISFYTTGTYGVDGSERARIDSSGNLLVGKTSVSSATVGCQLEASGIGAFSASGSNPLVLNRISNDGVIVSIRQDNTQEGNISVSGTTVSYNGGHLSRWAQTTTAKDESLVKGTVLSNLDEMNVYTDADGNTVQNEQLNKVKVSDVEGDVNVAGVFVNWDHDEDHNVDEINMAMTGDMIIRIAQGVTVQRGDLLMSAGDGTAKPQGDDIVRSKTIAKVTSTHLTCTYADGSFCVPCVLMAC